MCKHFAIIAALAALGMGPANAQHREATLYTIELPKATFNIVLATAKPGGWTGSIPNVGYPGAKVVYLMGAELWHPINDELLNVFKQASTWSIPTCSFHAEGVEPWQQLPVAVYVVPKEKPFPILTR
jgi:hypothetical protein